jgi:hypothetical protein
MNLVFDKIICLKLNTNNFLNPEIILCIRKFLNSFYYKSFEIKNYQLNVSNEINFYSHYFSSYKWVYEYSQGRFYALGINNIGKYLVVSLPIGTCSFCDDFMDRENFFSDEPKVIFDMFEKIDKYIDEAQEEINPLLFFYSFDDSDFYIKIKEFISKKNLFYFKNQMCINKRFLFKLNFIIHKLYLKNNILNYKILKNIIKLIK